MQPRNPNSQSELTPEEFALTLKTARSAQMHYEDTERGLEDQLDHIATMSDTREDWLSLVRAIRVVENGSGYQPTPEMFSMHGRADFMARLFDRQVSQVKTAMAPVQAMAAALRERMDYLDKNPNAWAEEQAAKPAPASNPVVDMHPPQETVGASYVTGPAGQPSD